MEDEARRDNIYASVHPELADFVFDEAVASVFADMIRRSVPGYATVLNMLPAIAATHVQAGSTCYDLGCSLGASTLAMRMGIRASGCRIIAVDNAPAMVDRCRSLIPERANEAPVEVVCADVREVPITDASMVVLNFTLQFIPIEHRLALLERIAAGMRPGGVLVLSEKIRFDDAGWQARITDIHHAFKGLNGYSDLEISQKRAAIERVLLPETEAQHIERLQAAGFQRAGRWFQCANFTSYLAIR